MDERLIGCSCALLAALVWAFAMILFKHSGERVEPLALNLFKNMVGIILMALTLAFMSNSWAELRAYETRDLWILTLSGFFGITLADTLFFYSLNLVGVGIVSIVDCMYSPFIIFFSWLLIAEQLTLFQYIGAGMVLLAVFITSRHAPPKGRTRGQLLLGIILGVMAMGTMGFGIVIAKPVLDDLSVISIIWATFIRLVGGTAALLAIVLMLPRRKALLAAFRPSRDWITSLPASFLGAYLACILWIAGFAYTKASEAAILNQINTIFALILATLILKETFTRRKLVAVIIALTGIFLVLSSGSDPH